MKFKATCKTCETANTVIACPNCSQQKIKDVTKETGFAGIQCSNCFHSFSSVKCGGCQSTIYLKDIGVIEKPPPPKPTPLETVLLVWLGFFVMLAFAFLFFKAFFSS